MTPYILLGRKKLPPECPPSSAEHFYDEQQQLWIDKKSGMPLVSCFRNQTQATKFGETLMTETREGVDQAEGTTIHQATQYGETVLTRTHEGADQIEGAFPQGFDAFNYNI